MACLCLAPVLTGLSNPSDQAITNVCTDQACKKSDATLNELYKQIMNRLKGDADTAKLLVAAQRAWIAFRDAECAFAASAVRQGSVYPMLVADCRDGLTGARANDLKSYLHCEEGVLDRPVPAK